MLRYESGPNIVTDGKKDFGPLDFTGKFAGRGSKPAFHTLKSLLLLLVFLCFL